MFETEFGTRMIRATEKIRAVAAEPSVADLLQAAAGFSAAVRRTRVLHLWGSAGGSPARLVCHNRVLLSERSQLNRAGLSWIEGAASRARRLTAPLCARCNGPVGSFRCSAK